MLVGSLAEDSKLTNTRVGLGTMGLGGRFDKDVSSVAEHRALVDYAIDLGINFFDTAEVYSSGLAEEIIGACTAKKRESVFIATKFSPSNHSFSNCIAAAEMSLKRLNTDYIDLYQVHWPNPSIPIEETLNALETLYSAGKVRYVGVSNFSVQEMLEASDATVNIELVSNQVEYNLVDRFVEAQILPYCAEINATLIAYSPLNQGKALQPECQEQLDVIARSYDLTVPQLLLNWLNSKSGVFCIPKSTNMKHVKDISLATETKIELADLHEVDKIGYAEIHMIDPALIKPVPDNVDNRTVYLTVEQAIENENKMSPSPTQLSKYIKRGDVIKPIKVKKIGKESYELREGRLRYWAWRIAHQDAMPIPAYIENYSL